MYLWYHALSLPVCILWKSNLTFWQQKSPSMFWILLQHLFSISINWSYFSVLHFLLVFRIFLDSFLCVYLDFWHRVYKDVKNRKHSITQDRLYGKIFENLSQIIKEIAYRHCITNENTTFLYICSILKIKEHLGP